MAASEASGANNTEINAALTEQEEVGARMVETEGNTTAPEVLVPAIAPEVPVTVAATEVTAVETPG